MVNAAVVVFIAVIAYNTMFKFFTMCADFLSKRVNQIYICSGNTSSATAVISTEEKIIQLGMMILDALKIKFLDTLKVNLRLNVCKVISIS